MNINVITLMKKFLKIIYIFRIILNLLFFGTQHLNLWMWTAAQLGSEMFLWITRMAALGSTTRCTTRCVFNRLNQRLDTRQ